MPLHRDIHWLGRQWAVTGHGMQAIDQKLGGQYDVEISRLWDEDVIERLRAQAWFNADDFSKGLGVARKRYPEPPRALILQPEASVREENVSPPTPLATPGSPTPAFQIEVSDPGAKFVLPWRIGPRS